ncbi:MULTISPECIES: DNA polymerase III subunit gamma/tau [unclassified Gilliamella]|uniref:DNA polymerase III subunit gamma/tau n=1 Tax=unclassified Gilliamella TaxID=2685620 RepID=UPI00226A3CDB|nr:MULTISPECIES: DNA polymerase III subunit gamma/tau [unclassified Gilliamella]MCX8642227.1 DNA polymerase III subunit gamma/tau [Gilliamella sp. B3835]MCX8707625.1 DNA polymerase III subunit gamma/tau [Gilliamella sp. B3783]MCX8710048.1 DNA polymerase III subunit gamma/tau [Gilliamella sp. B3780]MCX8713516.1 DNA polymerase III subunit gamma/tau [Gilliamella sp. B3781]MCX8716608.1 DNA polymerase III subunit gamma/tau [Gilliamella sp. B3784]
MSYQVLARKWRPKSFSEVVGQQHVLKILSNALSLGRVHHAYLFSGTRGVGKTSIARLLAKGLNCETGITATPCGVCDNCRDIEQGRFVDLLEIDAASRTKVEDTREILDNIQYLPTKGRFKVYLIDEVHMLSRSSFNALLKTLEEPPEHVKFLLATTDPQKLPITILSRCLHLHLNVLDTSLIAEQLSHILQLEQIESDSKAIQLLAKAANGSMRDGLSLTDQAIALGNGKVEAESVAMMLGTLDKSIPFSLVESLYHGDGNALMQQINVAATQGVDWDNLLADSIALLHQIALLQVVPTALGDYSDNEDRIRFLAQYMAPNDIQLFYQILLMGRKELAYAPDKKVGVEMSFLRALAFIPKTNEAVKPHTQQAKVAEQSPKMADSKPQVPPMVSSQQNQQRIEPKSNLQNTSVNSSNAKEQQKLEPIRSTTTEKIVAEQTITEDVKDNVAQSDLVIPDEASSITKNILEMRMQLIKEEQNTKKSESVAGKEQSQNGEEHSSLARIKNILPLTNEKEKNTELDSHTINDNDEEEITAENYQWQSYGLVETKDDMVIDTKAFRESLNGDKTPEMTQKLIGEMAQKDKWCAEIEQLELAPLIKQIAINSFLEQVDENNVVLHMRSSVKHLINSSVNTNKLEKALSNHRQQLVKLKVMIDDNQENKTPLEMREDLYQQKLEQAKQIIKRDTKIEMICQYFEAKIDEASIRPV